MRTTRDIRFKDRRLVVGSVVFVLLVVAVYMSTTAQRGLPFQDAYHVTVEFPNAKRLVATDQVKIAGVMVGTVAKVVAVPPAAGRGAFVRVDLRLGRAVKPLGVDTRTAIVSSSVLGGTSVELAPGDSARTVPEGGTIPLARSAETVQLTDLFDVFDAATVRGIDRTLKEVGTGLAGRGTAINQTLGDLSHLLKPLSTVSRTLASPTADLPRFISSYDRFVAGLAPVATELQTFVANGARTLRAMAGARVPLGQTIAAAPATELAVTDALTRVTPALNDLAQLAVDLRPGAARLPGTLDAVNATLSAGTKPLQQLPDFARRLGQTLDTVRTVSRMPSTDGAVRQLISLVDAAKPTVETLEQAQVFCNVVPVMFRNLAGAVTGLRLGPKGPPTAAFSLTHLGADGEVLQQGKPSRNVGINYQPIENETECEGGNEPSNGATQSFNSPPGPNGHDHVETKPPATSYQYAREAGLLTPPPGWKP